MSFKSIHIDLLANGSYEVSVTKNFDPEHGGGSQTFKENGGANPHRALDVAREMVTVSPTYRQTMTDKEWSDAMFTAWRENDQKAIQNLLELLPEDTRRPYTGTVFNRHGNPVTVTVPDSIPEDDGGRTRIGNTPETADDEKQDQDTLRFSLIEAIAEMYSTTFAAVSSDIAAMPLAEQAFDEFCKAMEDAGY